MSKNGSLKDVIRSWYRGWSDEAITTANRSLYHSNGVLYSYGDHFPLAIHIGSKILVNGDFYSQSTRKHQAYLIQELSERERVEVPFSALSSAFGKFKFGSYNISPKELETNLRVIDQEGDTWIDTGRVNDKTGEKILQHVLGACIFRYGYDENARYFFSGIDETGLGTHRYFLTELVSPVESVKEGLESMKPEEVKRAESEGLEVYRQGEWFFVELDKLTHEVATGHAKCLSSKNYCLVGANGDTGHHIASEGFSIGIKDVIDSKNNKSVQFVRGIVKHSAHDHKQCKLYTDVKDKEWFIAYHNVQLGSYNAVGNVD